MQRIAAAARAAEVRLGLEPTHVSESHESSFLSTIGEAIELLDEAELDDVGVMVDSVHVWDTPSLEDDITRNAHRITGLHVADKLAPGAAGRLLPGEGIDPPRPRARAGARHRLRRLRRLRDLLDPGGVLGSLRRRGRAAGARRAARTNLHLNRFQIGIDVTTQQPKEAIKAKDFLDFDHLLDDEERLIRDTVRAFVEERVNPYVAEWFEEATIPRELAAEIGQLGLLGMHLEGYGCAGASATAYGIACMELEAGDSGVRSLVSVQGSLAMFAIHRWGSRGAEAGVAAADGRPARRSAASA